MKCFYKEQLRAVCLLTVLAVLFYPAVGFSQAEETSETTTIERKLLGPELVAEPGHKEPVKRSMTISTTTGQYNIVAETKVVGTDGKPLTMESLPVPCEAEIVYQPLRNYGKNALTITVKNLLPKASTKWSDPLPQ